MSPGTRVLIIATMFGIGAAFFGGFRNGVGVGCLMFGALISIVSFAQYLDKGKVTW